MSTENPQSNLDLWGLNRAMSDMKKCRKLLPTARPLKVVELFSGPGGFGMALKHTAVEGFSFEHVWATDYDRDTAETYIDNVLDGDDSKFLCEDIRRVDIQKVAPEADGLVFGFPCNDFSIVGKSKGLDGVFGGLYKYGVQYLEARNPLFFIAENVTGLKSANSGCAFRQILTDLQRAGKYGYNLTVNLYRFENYGVPQARHRFIIVGLRGDLNAFFLVPRPSYRKISCFDWLYKFRNNSQFLKEKSELRVSDRVRKRLEYIPEGKNIWNVQDKLPLELRLKVKTSTLSQIYRRLNRAKPAYTITGSGGGGTYVYHWEEPRPLTNFEKARLQTFPVDFKFHGNKTSVKKQIGMAVPCIGAEKILTALLLRFAGKPYKSVEPEGVGLEGYFPSLKQN